MSERQLLTRVVAALETLGIPYMLTGSVASSLYGKPRGTHHVDIVVRLPLGRIKGLSAAFPPPEYYVSEDAIRSALETDSMFNVVEVGTGLKADFWLLWDDAYSQAAFARRNRVDAAGVEAWVCSPEDTILSKLRWAVESGGSTKQFGGVLAVYEVQGGALDRHYIESWVDRLGVRPMWEQVKSQARIID